MYTKFCMKNSIVAYFCQTTYFDPFWDTHPSKNNTEAGNLHRDIIFDHRFHTAPHLGQIISLDPFWGTLGVKKLPISLKVPPSPPEAANLYKETISHQRFDTVSHLGQIINFGPFWGHPWHQMGVQKGHKLPIALIITSKICNICMRR